MAHPSNQEIKAKVLAKMAGKVQKHRHKIAAARYLPHLRRGKKAPPMLFQAPRPWDGKKPRFWWDVATQTAAADAATLNDDTE